MRIFVTGAAGFVGQHLLPMLKSRDYQVTALVKNRQGKNNILPGVQVVVGDLARKGNWQNAIKGQDVVIHLAAQISSKTEDLFYRNNTQATKNLIDASKKFKIKQFILFSSAAVTSIRQDPYAKTKKDQEDLVLRSKLNYVFFRPSMIYGPGDTKNIGWLISFVKKMPIVPLPRGNIGRQPVYVKDMCKIVLKVVSANYSNKIFEIHGKEYITLRKMITYIIKVLKLKRIIVDIPIWLLEFIIILQEKIMPSPKFTHDQIKSLTAGERFKGESWWKTFGIIPTRFEAGVSQMIKK